jgi:arginyl-tRNA synthetase
MPYRWIIWEIGARRYVRPISTVPSVISTTHCLRPKFGLIAFGFEKYGPEEVRDQASIRRLRGHPQDAGSDPGVKAETVAWPKRMEDGDADALRNRHVWHELSVKKYAEEYNRLNVHFDVYAGESNVEKWQD